MCDVSAGANKLIGMLTLLFYVLIVGLVAAMLFLLASVVFGRGEELGPLPEGTTATVLPAEGISGADVRALRFQQVVRGYKAGEVDWALARLAARIDELQRELAYARGGTAESAVPASALRTGPQPAPAPVPYRHPWPETPAPPRAPWGVPSGQSDPPPLPLAGLTSAQPVVGPAPEVSPPAGTAPFDPRPEHASAPHGPETPHRGAPADPGARRPDSGQNGDSARPRDHSTPDSP